MKRNHAKRRIGLWGGLALCLSALLALGSGSAPGIDPVAGAGGESRYAVLRPAPDALGAVELARLAELRREIARHDELYFRQVAPEISDFEYDTLKAELRALEARNPEPSEVPEVGDDRTGVFETRIHRQPMGSLAKTYSDAELVAFHARMVARLGQEDVVYRVEPKYDGLAVNLTFENGRLVHAVTRGNGTAGDDVTLQARRFLRDFPARLAANAEGADGPLFAPPEVLEVRGEIFASWAEFSRINDEREVAGVAGFSHPRSLAVGTMRALEVPESGLRRLDWIAFGWGGWEGSVAKPETLTEFHANLRAWGLPVPKTAQVAVGREALLATVETVRRASESAGLPTDGVVVKLERVVDQLVLGVAPNGPRWAVARKFPPERTSTRVIAITLQVGRTGVVTPVAELEPILLGGSTVARATLHNADEIARRDVRVGDWVYVEKAGEIIPAIVGVDRARREAIAGGPPVYVFADTCPSCGEKVVRLEGQALHRCVNAACPAQLARRLAHFAAPAGMNIEGLGPVLVEMLLASGHVRCAADFYRLTEADLLALPSLGERSAQRLLRAIEASREGSQSDGARLLYALGLPSVGRESARKLAATFGSLEELEAAKEADFLRSEAEGGPGLGVVAARALILHIKAESTRAEWADLRASGLGMGWAKGDAGGARAGSAPRLLLAGQTVVLTGRLERWTRAEATARLRAAGARVTTAVTRETSWVVAGEGAGEKLFSARALGVEVVSEAELVKRLGLPADADKAQ